MTQLCGARIYGTSSRVIRLDIEQDKERLRQAALLLESENKRLVIRNVELTRRLLELQGMDPSMLQVRLLELEEQLAQRNQELFGKSSEKRRGGEPVEGGSASGTSSAGQSGGEANAGGEERPKRGHGPREQKNLPIEEVVHLLDEADKVCPCCGDNLEEMEGQFEESTEVDVIERHFVLKKHKRQKYRCGCNAHIETAPGPLKLFEKARYSLAFAVAVALYKYCDHLPLERQVRIFSREGLVVDSQTLWDQIEALAKVLSPLHEALRVAVLASPVIGADETRWEMLKTKWQEAGEAGRWYVWSACSKEAIYHSIFPDRSKQSAKQLLGGYTGTVVVDGYEVYLSLVKEGIGFSLANCWGHVRRKYIEAEANYPVLAGQALTLIRKLYAIEAEVEGEDEAALAKRKALREEKSRPVVEELRAWAEANKAQVLPQSSIGKAINYMLELWSGLTVFLDNPRVPLDNSATERGFRGLVVGRKNHYGSRSKRGTEVAALFYSLIESCKLNGVEPGAYMRDAARAFRSGAQSFPLPHELAAAKANAVPVDTS